jgi:hypothetical protein
MIITYHGAEFFKVSHGDLTLAFNPISKESKFKGPKFGADIALISLNHSDMNGIEQVRHGDREPFAVTGPGEYEIRDVLIKGFGTKSKYNGGSHINTVYFVELEGMTICYLGALGSKELPQDLRQNIDTIDILFLPIGGEGVLEPDDAHDLAVELEPAIVIPMHYPTSAAAVGVKDALNIFLKEEGKDAGKPVEKLTLKRKDLEGKAGEVVVLSA